MVSTLEMEFFYITNGALGTSICKNKGRAIEILEKSITPKCFSLNLWIREV